jgi:two-component system chemotaxis sensor kinase CheA
MDTNTPFDPFLRIKADKVMQLIDSVGELGLATSAVTRHPALAGLELEGFENAAHRLELLTRQVQELASALRMVPANQVFERMRRLARDLTHQTGKKFECVFKGEDVEIDKVLADKIADPLMHLIRNAVDHGLETSAERIAAGKSEHGCVTLSAVQQGQEIHIAVSDDGRGLNREAILNRARQAGLVHEDQALDDAAIWNFIFQSGFSTATQVSNLSGRGVGMDVVQNNVRALRGRIVLATTPGKGTRVTLIIPLTLAFLESMIVRSHQCLYAIPVDAINQVFKPSDTEVVHASASAIEFVRRQDVLVPVLRLHNTIGQRAPLVEQIIVITQTAQGVLGLPVDEIVGEQQVVMKPLEGQLQDIRGGAGCALLPSGEIAIALDVERLGEGLLSTHGAARTATHAH